MVNVDTEYRPRRGDGGVRDTLKFYRPVARLDGFFCVLL